jgi:hypothetical protein
VEWIRASSFTAAWVGVVSTIVDLVVVWTWYTCFSVGGVYNGVPSCDTVQYNTWVPTIRTNMQYVPGFFYLSGCLPT